MIADQPDIKLPIQPVLTRRFQIHVMSSKEGCRSDVLFDDLPFLPITMAHECPFDREGTP